MEEPALVQVQNLSKKFCRNFKRSLWYGLKDLKNELIGKNINNHLLRPEEFWVNKDINFEVKRGECIGLIGKNGAGKSTLLKILTGLIKPDAGQVVLRGRVGALIELGAGFNPVLTGRENVFNSGAVLGFSKAEMQAKYDEIVAFAELKEFMDTPVQYYSSGMKVRLGFAVATHTNPDILILDEVLAVGDASFRAKCYNRIGKLRQKAALIFVSHSMQQIAQICDKVLVLNKGKISWLGEVGQGISIYNKQNSDHVTDEFISLIEDPITSATLALSKTNINFDESFVIKFDVTASRELENCILRIVLYNSEGLAIAEWSNMRHQKIINLKQGKNSLNFELGPIRLRAGIYPIGFVLNDSTGVFLPYWSLKEHSITVEGNYSGSCEYQL